MHLIWVQILKMGKVPQNVPRDLRYEAASMVIAYMCPFTLYINTVIGNAVTILHRRESCVLYKYIM